MLTSAAVSVEPATTLDQVREVADLLASVWGAPAESPPLRADAVRALAHSGAYVVLGRVGGAIVGASVGWLGHHDGEVALHSHMTGVVRGGQGSGVGWALKQHQRQWALERDITLVTWTFDPLVRRNAWFNLTKLGATIGSYEVDFYGPMDDDFNHGDTTDRAVVIWRLDSERAVAAAAGAPGPPFLTADATALLRVGDDGWPKLGSEVPSSGGAACQVPPDIVSIRHADPDAALAWRVALRATLGSALQHGWRTVGMAGDGWYVLDPPASREAPP